jgi:hypothetical protein
MKKYWFKSIIAHHHRFPGELRKNKNKNRERDYINDDDEIDREFSIYCTTQWRLRPPLTINDPHNHLWLNEWTNEWMNYWTNEWVSEWKNLICEN